MLIAMTYKKGELSDLCCFNLLQAKTKGCTANSMIRSQHVDKGKLNKFISKASVDTIFCLTQ